MTYAFSNCANCRRNMAHTRMHTPPGMLIHEAHGLCRECYGNKQNRARLIEVVSAPQPLRDAVEQAVARGHPPSRIMRDHNIDYETYRKIRDAMDTACRGGETR